MRHLFLITSVLFTLSSLAQEVLPKGHTPREIAEQPFYKVPHSRASFTAPPTNSNLRTAAEWEEMRGTVISWKAYTTFLSEIVRYAQEEGLVYIFCSDSNSVRSTLQNASIPLNNVRCIEESTNSVWIRDYGPNNVYLDEVGELIFVDWVYNRSRPEDDLSPEVLGDYIGIDVYGSTSAPTDLVNTGGNFMADGLGNAFSSNLVMEENEYTSAYNSTPKTEAEVDQIIYDYMNIDNYIKMQVLDYDDIHHIDMHMKLLDEETILVGEYPDGIADGPKIEQNIQYILDNFTTPFGTQYKIERIPMPQGTNWSGNPAWPSSNGTYTTYTNSLIINKTILVPIYNYTSDADALQVYEDLMPGYNVIGINSNDPIQASGAIHCTSHEIGVDNPLWIVHQALVDQEPYFASYEVSAQIKHIDGISSAYLYYKLEGDAAYQPVSMSNTSDDTWVANIPQQVAGSTVHYYVEGNASTGKTQVRPMPAPEGYWHFDVLLSNNINNDFEAITLKYFQKEDYLNIYYRIDQGMDSDIQLLDISGKLVANIHSGISEHGVNQHKISCSHLAKGMYIVNAQFGQQFINKKIIIE